jgi:hypothetical protein
MLVYTTGILDRSCQSLLDEFGIERDPLWRVTAKQDHGWAVDPVTCFGKGSTFSSYGWEEESGGTIPHCVCFLVFLIDIVSRGELVCL